MMNTPSYIKYSTKKLNTFKIRPNKRLVSCDVKSWFTKVPIKDIMDQISKMFSDNVTALFNLADLFWPDERFVSEVLHFKLNFTASSSTVRICGKWYNSIHDMT